MTDDPVTHEPENVDPETNEPENVAGGTPSPDRSNRPTPAGAYTPGGDPVHEHHDPTFADTAPRDEARRQAFEFHLRRFLGDDFTLLTERVSPGIHLDLYVFAPSADVPHVTLVTAGVSDRPMTLPDGAEGAGDRRLELMLAVPPGWPGLDPLTEAPLEDPKNFWPIKMLKDVARIPSTYDSHLAWGHSIIDDEGSLVAPGVRFGGALVGPPLGYPPPMMRATTPAGEVDLLAVLPVLPDELDFKVATPGGGDALIGRLQERGVTAVVDPDRPAVVGGPPPWSVHVLTDAPLRHLGDALATVMPNRAALLAETGSIEEVIPAGADEDFVRWRVSGPLAADALRRDAAAGAAADELRPALDRHRSVITLTPESHDPEHPTIAVMALVSMLIEGDADADQRGVGVAAIWLPQQRHVTTAAQFHADIEANVPLTFRVHPVDLPGGAAAVQTHGLAALGGQEVLYREDELDHPRLTKWANRMLGRHFEDTSELPAPGTVLKYGWTKYQLVEIQHPVSGEPVLEILPAPKKRGLFGRGR